MKKREPVIQLDRSKPYSEVRGDRLPNDPNYSVAFVQDTLPFDVNGNLVPDDGKTTTWEVTIGTGSDKETHIHHPLYSDAMREKVKRKLDRLAKGQPAIEEEAEAEAAEEEEDVNLTMWLRGDAAYSDVQVFAAAGKRYSVRYTKRPQLVVDLVYDHKLVPENEVTPSLRKLLTQAA